MTPLRATFAAVISVVLLAASASSALAHQGHGEPSLPGNVHVRPVFQTPGGMQTSQQLHQFLYYGQVAAQNNGAPVGLYGSVMSIKGNSLGSPTRTLIDRITSGSFNVRMATIAGDNTVVSRLRARLANTPNPLVQCLSGNNKSCFGGNYRPWDSNYNTKKNNHNKFLVINDVHGSPSVKMPVSVQSSANWTAPQLTDWHQATVFVYGDNAGEAGDLARAYRNYWGGLQARSEGRAAWLNVNPYSSPSGALRLYLFPRSGDPIATALGRARCDDPDHRNITIAQANFVDRPEVVAALKRLSGKCRVNIYVDPNHIRDDATMRRDLRDLNNRMFTNVRCVEKLHSKYMAMNTYDANAGRPMYQVFTGSHNWNTNSLRNTDEAMLRIRDYNVWRSFTLNGMALNNVSHSRSACGIG